MNFSGPVENPDLVVLSLGAGVQSTVMALMAAHCEIEPMPDGAIFADTGWEPAPVYDHLEWLTTALHNHFPVHIVTKGNLRDDALSAKTSGTPEYAGRWASMPWFVLKPDGTKGMLPRQCTKEYKIDPVNTKIRRLLGVGYRQRMPKGTKVEVWMGISYDEIIRMKPSRQKYLEHRWPLIEKELHRGHCLAWFAENYPGRPLIKSACIGCPYHNNAQWREIKENANEWAEVVEFDRTIRHANGINSNFAMFLHRDCIPLDEVDLRTKEEKGQGNFFLEECEGMCGV